MVLAEGSTQTTDSVLCELSVVKYDGHAVSLWWKSTRGVVANEPQSDSQGLHCEV